MWKFNLKKLPQSNSSAPTVKGFMAQDHFFELLHVEQKRTERSRRPFILMLLEPSRLHESGRPLASVQKILETLRNATRETDIMGWYREGSVIGVIFTEVTTSSSQVVAALSLKISNALAQAFAPERIIEGAFTFHIYPDHWLSKGPGEPGLSAENRDLVRDTSGKSPLALKRCIDVAGSLAALIVLTPVFALIAIVVKITSKGPVIFRQERLGQFGRPFTFLKFRSMDVECDSSIHEQFVANHIQGGSPNGTSTAAAQPCYKIQNDPRVTRVGKFLRKTSLDELPQFVNVLKGDMSLVGPRPPIQYEVARYQFWHIRRLQSVKPGITGTWQVDGRSRVDFDEMVRMDLRYAQNWSVWLDLKILFRTPGAVISGGGAL